MAKLTEKQKIFVDEYLIDLNGTRAYKAAYCKVKKDETAAVNASRLLRKANISDYIQKAMDARSKRTEITQDRVLKEYARLAFLDPRKFFNKKNNLKHIVDLDADTAACLAGMDINVKHVKNKEGESEPETVKKIKLIDKKGALDSLARHLGMFDKKDVDVDEEEWSEILFELSQRLPE